MNLLIEQKGTVVVIKVKDERLDWHNADEFSVQLTKLFEEGKYNIVVDLHKVRFVDEGLEVLAFGFKKAGANHGSLKLCALQPQVKSTFELCRLDRVFEIFSGVEEALDSF